MELNIWLNTHTQSAGKEVCPFVEIYAAYPVPYCYSEDVQLPVENCNAHKKRRKSHC